MTRRFFIFWLCLCVPAVFASYAQANEPLVFRAADETNYREALVLHELDLKDHSPGKTPYLVARTDLDGDGVDEYFVKKETPNSLKPFYIFSLHHREVSQWAEIKALKIEITDKKSWGVRRLLVYNHPGNDFRSETWEWDPQKTRFVPEK